MRGSLQVLWFCPREVSDFIRFYGSGRITATSKEYYTTNPQEGCISVISRGETGRIRGVSCSGFKDSKTFNSVTAVLPEIRGQGYGRALLENKILWLNSAGIMFETVVAQDNPPSLGMMRGCKLLEVLEVISRERLNPKTNLKERYKAFRFIQTAHPPKVINILIDKNGNGTYNEQTTGEK